MIETELSKNAADHFLFLMVIYKKGNLEIWRPWSYPRGFNQIVTVHDRYNNFLVLFDNRIAIVDGLLLRLQKNEQRKLNLL